MARYQVKTGQSQTKNTIHKAVRPMDKSEQKSEYSHWIVKVNQAYNKIRTGHVNIKLITNFNTYITKCKLL